MAVDAGGGSADWLDGADGAVDGWVTGAGVYGSYRSCPQQMDFQCVDVNTVLLDEEQGSVRCLLLSQQVYWAWWWWWRRMWRTKTRKWSPVIETEAEMLKCAGCIDLGTQWAHPQHQC